MSPTDLTTRYFDIVFSGKNYEALEKLLAPTLQFRGPLFNSDTSVAYIAALKKTPFEDASYTLIKSFEDDTSACVIFHMSAHGLTDIPMMAYTTVTKNKIDTITLIFDSSAFNK